jgi:hypothetical protein
VPLTASAEVAGRSDWPLGPLPRDAPALGGSLALGFGLSPPVTGVPPLAAGSVRTGETVTGAIFTDGTVTDGTVPTGVTIAGVCTGGVEIGGVEIGGVAIAGTPRGTGIVTVGRFTAGTSTASGDCCAAAGIPPIPTTTTTTVTPMHQRPQFMLSPRSRTGKYSSRCVVAWPVG